MSDVIRLANAAIPIERIVSVCSEAYMIERGTIHLGYEWGDSVKRIEQTMSKDDYDKWWDRFLFIAEIENGENVENVIMPYSRQEYKHRLNHVLLPLSSVKKVSRWISCNPMWYDVFHMRGPVQVQTEVYGDFREGNQFWVDLLARLGIEDDPELMEVVL